MAEPGLSSVSKPRGRSAPPRRGSPPPWTPQAASSSSRGCGRITREHGRSADYSPASADIPPVVEAMTVLGRVAWPNVELKDAGQRCGAYLDDPPTPDCSSAPRFSTPPATTPTCSSPAWTPRALSTGPGPPAAPPGSIRPAGSSGSSSPGTSPRGRTVGHQGPRMVHRIRPRGHQHRQPRDRRHLPRPGCFVREQV
jgi:hypothetical protein